MLLGGHTRRPLFDPLVPGQTNSPAVLAALLLVLVEYAVPRDWSESFLAQSSDLFGRFFVSFQLRFAGFNVGAA
jgi:hypothetical protein